jgi:hypothetical protein
MGPPTETRLCDTLERAVKDSAPGLGASVMSARLASSGFLSFEIGGMATLASRCIFHVCLRLPRHPSAQLLDITWFPFFSESHAGSQHPILPQAIPELLHNSPVVCLHARVAVLVLGSHSLAGCGLGRIEATCPGLTCTRPHRSVMLSRRRELARR